jgi:queuine tRNA-ribosyltransferase
MAQQGIVFTRKGPVRLDKLAYQMSDEKMDTQCACWACENHSRGFIHHLTRSHETLGWRACAYHNTYFYQKLMKDMRDALDQDRFTQFKEEFLKNWYDGELKEREWETRESAVLRHEKKKQSRTRIQVLN